MGLKVYEGSDFFKFCSVIHPLADGLTDWKINLEGTKLILVKNKYHTSWKDTNWVLRGTCKNVNVFCFGHILLTLATYSNKGPRLIDISDTKFLDSFGNVTHKMHELHLLETLNLNCKIIQIVSTNKITQNQFLQLCFTSWTHGYSH